MTTYDLVVIGSGPAGEKGAAQAAYLGKSVCVVDKGPAGGAWVNTGTIPSKTLRESALYLAGGRQRGLHGHFSTTANIRDLMALERRLVTRWREKIEKSFRNHGITRMIGRARFLDPHRLDVDREVVEANAFLICTGSRPRVLPGIEPDGDSVHDSDTILRLTTIPQTMVVLGGGVIGCEYASIFQALGVQVTLLNSRDRLLGFLEPEVSERLEGILCAGGMVIRHETRFSGVERSSRGVTVFTNDGTLVPADLCFSALGRVPNTDDLGLELAGVDVDQGGNIPVDEFMRTSQSHIYAAGDVVGFPSLGSVSMEQGRVATGHLCGDDRGPMAELFPYGIFTIPEVSTVGMTCLEAKQQGFDPVIGRAGYHHSVRAAMLGDENGEVRLVVDRESHRLLGATLIGQQATELIHLAAMAIKTQQPVDDWVRFVFNLPSLSVLYKQAAYDALHAIRSDGQHNELVE